MREDVEADYFSSNAFELFDVPVALGRGCSRPMSSMARIPSRFRFP
jgi:hypothetical protein